MSLLKLLTTGKSLVGLKDAESRYRMTNQRLLPKFGSGKNPFRSTEGIEAMPAETKPEVTEPMPAAVSAAPAPAVTPAGQNAGLLRLGTAKCRDLAAAALQNRWVSQLGSLLPRPARKPTPTVVGPILGKAPLQGELSLDRIKVMRNDLSDADLEVVPAKPRRTAPATAPPAKQTANSPEASEARVAAPELVTDNR